MTDQQTSPMEPDSDPVRPRFRLVLGASVSLVAGLEVWIAATITGEARTVMMAGEAVTALSAFLLGNTYRLRDYRRRLGFEMRAQGTVEQRTLSRRLPPPQVVRRRIEIAFAGSVIGEGATLYAGFSLEAGGNDAQVLVLMGVVVALLCGFGGTHSRPLD